MPQKGMRSLCFNPETPLFQGSMSPSSSITSPASGFSESMIEQIIDTAAIIVAKWDGETSSYAKVTSMFYESKREAVHFIRSVNDLRKIMHFVSGQDSGSKNLIRAQSLMQIAMKRLQKEFYQILSMNRAHLDPESVSTRSSRTSTQSSFSDYDYDASPDYEIGAAKESISEVEEVSFMAMSDLKSIADCMISSGYAKECVQIYNMIRKSIINEGIYKLGIEKVSLSKINKMESGVLNLKIKDWLEAMKISMRTLFTGERILCDFVFSSSNSIRESCFSEITKEGAVLLFEFPEVVAKVKKSSPERIFQLLGMYTAISDNWPEIKTIFSFESISASRSQALNSMARLSESVRLLLLDFESMIQKDSSKTIVPGGGIHPLTIYSMNYLTALADYGNILTDIISDWPPPAKSSLPEISFYSLVSNESSAAPISDHISQLILVIVCKLDSKAKYYKDVAVLYLFLANNLQYVISRIHKSNLHSSHFPAAYQRYNRYWKKSTTMPLKWVFFWQPNAGSTVNSQILNEVSQCVESINGVKEGRWKATLTFYKPMLRDQTLSAEFPREFIGISLPEQPNKYYFVLRFNKIVLESDSSIQLIMEKLQSYKSRVALNFEGFQYQLGDFQLRVGKVVPSHSENLRGIVMEVEYLPISSLEKSKQIMEEFSDIWKDAISKRSLPGHFIHIEPNFSDYGLADHYTSQHTAVQYTHVTSQLIASVQAVQTGRN